MRLLVDGIGAWLGGRLDVAALRGAGVEVVKFVPPFRSILRGRANLRNHRKMLIADAARLWCGGRNFAAEYFEGDPRREGGAVWRDLSFDLRGEIALRACEQFEKDWAYARRAPAEDTCLPLARDRAGGGAARPARAERAGADRRHRAGAAALGLLHGAGDGSSP